MSMFLGPLDATGCVPPRQQTRVSAFLISCHGAIARQLTIALTFEPRPEWQNELNAQVYRETEIVSLMLRATSWVADPQLLFMAPSWEVGWVPKPAEGITDRMQALTVDIAALGHALHTVIRPAALLPDGGFAQDAFTLALRKIEFESSRLMQAQIIFLKSPELLPFREAVTAAVESRHSQVRKLWTELLASIGVECKQPLE